MRRVVGHAGDHSVTIVASPGSTLWESLLREGSARGVACGLVGV